MLFFGKGLCIQIIKKYKKFDYKEHLDGDHSTAIHPHLQVHLWSLSARQSHFLSIHQLKLPNLLFMLVFCWLCK